MLLARRLGLTPQLPPERIAVLSLARLGAPPSNRTTRNLSAVAAHLGFGMGAGSLFGVLHRRLPLPTLPAALGYGLTVWAVSYLGWVPALGFLPSAEDDDRRRVAVMVTAHLVYALVLGSATRRLHPPDSPEAAA
jgi:hypothetical protein